MWDRFKNINDGRPFMFFSVMPRLRDLGIGEEIEGLKEVTATTFYGPRSKSYADIKDHLRRSDNNEPFKIEEWRRRVRHETLNDFFEGYFDRKEWKSHPEDGTGLLEHRRLIVVAHIPIGKESDAVKDEENEEAESEFEDETRPDTALQRAAVFNSADAWHEYAKGCPKPYVYTHFSTLYRRWLSDEGERRTNGKAEADGSNSSSVFDVSAEEDHLSELSWKRRLDPKSTVLVLCGFNSSLRVRNDALSAFDAGEERAFAKVTHGLKAVVFLGDGGNITVDAIKWCAAQNVAICVLDWLGDLVSFTSRPAAMDVSLRRAQFTADRLAVAKAIIREKLASGRRIGKLAARSWREALEELKAARSVEEVIRIEGRMALEYWSNWRFELKHRKRNWPPQWTLFSYRASQISGGPRHATHPVNVILNYAYSVAATQITRSLIAFGFDSTAGFLHADAQGRHSLTYDVLELLRADVDAAILPWVAKTIWRRADFPVTPSGVVRLQPTLAAAVAERAVLPQKHVDSAIQWLSDQLQLRPPALAERAAATL
jgi:CRISPR-associated endonuclease Cas1